MTTRVSSPVFIGRSSELDQMRSLLDRVAGNVDVPAAVTFGDAGMPRAGAVLIGGDAGVGKTRLVSELRRIAELEGATVLLGGCVVLGEGALPYAPVAEAIRGFARTLGPGELDVLLGPARSELARLVPGLAVDAGPGGAGTSSDWAQSRLFELFLGLLDRLAAEAPVMLIIEDLHWSDRSTRDLIGFLVRNLRDTPVVLVMTYRADELHRRHPLLSFLAELGRTGLVDRIELAPFDRREAADQLHAIAGHDLDPELVTSIFARSGGNAFYAEELLAAVGETGRVDLPETLRDALLARVAELSEPTQELLRVASAAGRRVDPALLAVASSTDEPALYEALREAVARQVLVPDETTGVERYAFRHALVQEAIYDELLPGERTRLHSSFARTLEACCGDAGHAAELAYHWHQAANLPRALGWSVTAGAAAEAAYAFPEAVVQYERAVALWDQVPDAEARAGRDRVDLLATLAGVARYHEPARGVAHIQSAIELVDEQRDPVRRGLLNERLGRYAWIAGQGELAHAAYRTATRLIPARPPTAARARALAGLAQIEALSGRFSEARKIAEEALEIARPAGARDVEGHATNSRGMGRAIEGDIDGGLEDMATALAIAEEAGNVDDIGRAHANRTWVLDVAGRLEDAVEAARTGVRVAEQLGVIRFFGAHLLCGEADYLYRLGRWDEAERAVRRAEHVGSLGVNSILEQELLGRLAMARGRFDEATQRLRPLAAAAERAADLQFVNPVQASLAELALWQGQPQAALDQLMRAIPGIAFIPEVRIGELYALGLRAAADVTELAIARRSPSEERAAIAAGEQLLDAIRARHAELVATRPVFKEASESWLLLCEAEATRLHHRSAVTAWVAVAESRDRLGLPYPLAYARWREAEARLAAHGDRHQATSALREAAGIARALGAVPLATEIAALATRGRLVLDTEAAPDAIDERPVADPASTLGLTAREREVLALIALGRTNRQIAEALFISQNTAGVHVSNILGKLGVGGRGEAAALAYRLGLVDPVDPSASSPD